MRRAHSQARHRGKSSRLQDPDPSEEESEEEEEERYTRRPLGSVQVENQQSQRTRRRPSNKMPGRNKKRRTTIESRTQKHRSRSPSSEKEDRSSTSASHASGSVALASGSHRGFFSKVVLDLQSDLSAYNGRDKSKKMNHRDKTEMEKQVYVTAKHQFFKGVKYVNAKSLDRATEWVFNYIQPKDCNGMPADLLAVYKTTWINRYKDEVRKGINDKRTNIQQEGLKLIKKKIHNGESEVLVLKDGKVWDLLLRKDLEADDEDSAANRRKFDFLVDEFIPKVATSDAWGPNCRHTTPMCAAKQDVPDGKTPPLCVTVSDLAYVHSYFVSYGDQLQWEVKRHKGELAPFPDDHEVVEARGKVSYEAVHNGKATTIYFEERPEPVHIKSEGGRCPFGGWQKAGIDIYKKKRSELSKIYETSNSRNNKDWKRIEKADQDCLARLRTKHNREAIEQKRRDRASKKGGSLLEYDDDEGEDFDD